uniref:ATP phosphoribosyltransferase n=1 Tax=Macrostomum lignano TaxID=282301 RepID=A0A1I8F1K5_9PLAT
VWERLRLDQKAPPFKGPILALYYSKTDAIIYELMSMLEEEELRPGNPSVFAKQAGTSGLHERHRSGQFVGPVSH